MTRMHVVTEGETIQSIASTYGVDWVRLVEVNGLEYPYVSSSIEKALTSFNESVATIGSKIVIPTHSLNFEKQSETNSEMEEAMFGVDLSLSQPKVVSNSFKGELDEFKHTLDTVSGIENLKQQLLTRLSTRKGALWKHPEFGSELDKYIGKKTTKELLTEVGLEVKRTLLMDFRVDVVEVLRIEFVKGGIYVDCRIHPVKPHEPFEINYFVGGAHS